MKKSLGNIVVKNIQSTSLFRPRLLKKLKVNNRKLFKDIKTHFNVIAIFSTHILIIKTKGVRFYAEGFTIRL